MNRVTLFKIISCIIGTGFLAGCSPTTTTVSNPIKLSADTVVSLNDAMGSRGLTRFNKNNILLAVGRLDRPFESTYKDQIIAAAKAVSNVTPLIMKYTIDTAAADIVVHFRLPKIKDPTPSDVYGKTRTFWNSNKVLRKASIFINPTLPPSLRNLTIQHELIHAIGIGHVECESSIMYAGTTGNPSWELSPLDQALLKAWYSLPSKIKYFKDLNIVPAKSKNSKKYSERHNNHSVDIITTSKGPWCTDNTIMVLASPEGEVWWCRKGEPPLECFIVSGDAVPDLNTPAKGWYLDDNLYLYNPAVG